MPEGGRLRNSRLRKNRVGGRTRPEFINPYPWMSTIEAMVHLELERRGVPFSWRYFDGEAVTLKFLMPAFAPEFTLREYKVVILVAGNFFGTLPGTIDSNALAAALLEADGWKTVTYFEDEIRADVRGLIDRTLPELVKPATKGKPRANPLGVPDFMQKRREQLRGQGLRRKKFRTDTPTDKDSRNDRSRRRRRIRSRTDSGRLRRGGSGTR